MNNELISVILPIYNVELYLKECIESVISQSYKNLEIILVDDGSTDQSPYICDEYVKIDNRIKVIHKENGGLSDARNVGIQASSGSYIALVDSDDLIAQNFIEELYEGCIKSNAMIAACAYSKFSNEDEIVCFNNLDNAQVISGRELIKQIYLGQAGEFGFVAWNKLYSRKLFDNVQYPFGRIYEDTYTTYKLFLSSDRIILLNRPLYFYRIRPESIMTTRISLKKIKDGVDADASVVKYFQENQDYEILPYVSSYFCKQAVLTYYKWIPKVNHAEKTEAKKYLKTVYKQTWIYCRKSNMNFKKKVFYCLIRIVWSVFDIF